ncbi:hypothetical protein NF27_AN00030 [Candidatus Jidaibacter acanthamoeba]|uniref:Uncharacterized protein n=1 Tax=Candidatus Jidaibacter acanthamoebae TaxID=86105 RepID=A0A0C1QVP4_9RICK|nr:hypothetical protein [Candidatus Jidaibacter acanthamoeba]KIE04075.1 hypothetical protein NF27_JT00020 [Candidatus Jidaibacter acanthamoeba]KIE06264.1 hypothetical protein NF27_AN00030 [Candidatus Jidaibacter acanthamoeba]
MEESHYKRMLKRIIEVFDDYKKGKRQSGSILSVTSSNTGALDALPIDFENKTNSFLDSVRAIKEEDIFSIEKEYTPDSEEERKRIVNRIEEYEPYIHELLKIDR